MLRAQLTANAVELAGPARRAVCPDTPVNARATITLNAYPVPQQRLESLLPHLVLEALRRLPEVALALAPDAFSMRVST
jgi:hypothetical protein